MRITDIQDINNGLFYRRINETETSGCCAEAAPENPRKIIDIGYNGDEDQLTESEQLIWQYNKELLQEDIDEPYEEEEEVEKTSISERIKLRKEFNKRLTEAIEQGKIEEINNEEKPLGKVRYELQKFSNGGTPYIDESGTPKTDGEKGGMSQYEQWRYELNNKKRIKRLEQERDDANSPYHSPRITQADPESTLDNQIDQFLADYIKNQKKITVLFIFFFNYQSFNFI